MLIFLFALFGLTRLQMFTFSIHRQHLSKTTVQLLRVIPVIEHNELRFKPTFVICFARADGNTDHCDSRTSKTSTTTTTDSSRIPRLTSSIRRRIPVLSSLLERKGSSGDVSAVVQNQISSVRVSRTCFVIPDLFYRFVLNGGLKSIRHTVVRALLNMSSITYIGYNEKTRLLLSANGSRYSHPPVCCKLCRTYTCNCCEIFLVLSNIYCL